MVSGGSGYLASRIVKMLLEDGMDVHATGRDLSNHEKVETLEAVATAQIKAGFTPKASGRHIVVSEETTPLDIANILRNHFGNACPFPRRGAPKFLFWLIAPMYGRTRKYVSRNGGIPIRFDNSYSKRNLDMSYRPIEQTIKEHFQQISDDGLLSNAYQLRGKS
jgi:nucleoside-diphosphate-sugar epimerase